jgi:hypothetical protein
MPTDADRGSIASVVIPVWVLGDVYDYYGRGIRPVARTFDGLLEQIAFEFVPPCETTEGPTFLRAARTLALCVRPRVRETLGGVMRADVCRHDWPDATPFVARFGPNAGRLCCPSCGGAVSGITIN